MEFSANAKFVLLLAQIITVSSAVLVAFHPNILRAAVSLLFAFLGVAVMFLFAAADLLAGVQVIIYVGGITILILFAIMLTQWMYFAKLKDARFRLIPPLVILFFGMLIPLHKALKGLFPPTEMKAELFAEFANSPKTHAVGEALLGNYVLPFEAITVLLLGALVGAVWLARPTQ